MRFCPEPTTSRVAWTKRPSRQKRHGWLSLGWGEALEFSVSFSCPDSSFLAGNSFPLSAYLDFVPPILSRLTVLALSPQVNKTLKATLQALLEVVASEDGDILDSLQASPSTESLKSTSSDPGTRQAGRRRNQQQETETFYITVGLDRCDGATKGSIEKGG